MSTLTSVWDQRKRSLLTFGFVRSSFTETPSDIVDVILSFYDDMKYWRISAGKQMERFLKSKCSETMHGPKFTMKGIEFECIVAPNGFDEEHEGKVALILSVNKMPENVEYVYVHFVMFCIENKYQHKVTPSISVI